MLVERASLCLCALSLSLLLTIFAPPIGHRQQFYFRREDEEQRLPASEEEEGQHLNPNAVRKLLVEVQRVKTTRLSPSSMPYHDGPMSWTLSDSERKAMERKDHDKSTWDDQSDQAESQGRPSSRKLRGRQVQQIKTAYLQRKHCDGIKKIVQCKGGIPEDICKQELIDNGVVIVNDMKDTMFFAICINTLEEIDMVSQLTRIESIEDDPPRTLTHVSGSRRSQNVNENGQTIPYGVELVKAPQFWDHYGSKGTGITVCVIDTGLRATHEDFAGADLSGSNGQEHFLPWNKAGLFHGTHITGIIAARDNNVGVVGVAPEVSIYMVRFPGDGRNCTVSDLIDAMRLCHEAGADIINMSLGGTGTSTAEQNYIRHLRNSGVLLVASSGNDGDYGYFFTFPAAYSDVISVGAVDDKQRIATFSTYNLFLDLVAPGVEILSMGTKSDHSYVVEDGTSMAAPHVSGVAALLWSQFPNASSDEILTALTESARDLGACGHDSLYGFGMVDAMAAAAYLENVIVISSDIEKCVEVEITVKTDIWGNETMYFVTPNGNQQNILYRQGPYDSLLIATYNSTFLLPDGCYDLVLFDLMGDGTDCVSKGRFTVTYDDVEQIDYHDFTGLKEVLTFGNCH